MVGCLRYDMLEVFAALKCYMLEVFGRICLLLEHYN